MVITTVVAALCYNSVALFKLTSGFISKSDTHETNNVNAKSCSTSKKVHVDHVKGKASSYLITLPMQTCDDDSPQKNLPFVIHVRWCSRWWKTQMQKTCRSGNQGKTSHICILDPSN